MTKKAIIRAAVSLSVHFSMPLRVWNVSPPPPHALPSPAPPPCVKIKTTIISPIMIFSIKSMFSIQDTHIISRFFFYVEVDGIFLQNDVIHLLYVELVGKKDHLMKKVFV